MKLGLREIRKFGVFEVDSASGELRKSGIRIKLQDQPFQILAALLERPGEIVTREELRSRIIRCLWGVGVAFIVSMVGTGIGIYYGRRIARSYGG